MIELGLVVSRLLQYAATTTLFGIALFPLYAYDEPAALARWRRLLLWTSTALAIVSGISWFLFSAANMSGNLADMADADMLTMVAGHTGFGVVWTWRLLLALLILVVLFAPVPANSTGHQFTLALFSALLLLSLAGVGHTQVEEGWENAIHVAADGAHLLAAGAWLGGLVPLAFIVVRHLEAKHDSSSLDEVLVRFSGMGYLAVATLVGTGLVNSWFLVGSLSNLLATGYGQLLLVKLALFLGMLALAVANRFWVIPALEKTATGETAAGRTTYLRKLRNHVAGEQLLGMAILVIVSVLGTAQPAISQ